ncbi:methylmalonyl-CoA epimerase [Natribacillus halophilus]|nr:methylmalonyl-CoA epimerase [Natribacillus halophilus]
MEKPPTKIDHIGIAVRSIEERLPYYQDVLGLSLLAVEDVPHQQVKVAILAVGEVNIELLEPLDDDGPIARFIVSKGEGLHHVAFQVEDIAICVQELNREDASVCLSSTVSTGAGGQKVAFLNPSVSGGVLYELVEKNER